MPGIRYYDYGVMRRESEQRMYDAQRRSANGNLPYRRVKPEYGEQTRPETRHAQAESQDALMCDTDEFSDTSCGECRCAEETDSSCRAAGKTGLGGIPAEELLIAALLILAISEGGDLPLILALAYLLI